MARPDNKTWGIGNHRKKLALSTGMQYSIFDEGHSEERSTSKGVKGNPQKVFKNKINFQVQANTFDAKHMDKILGTEF